MCRLIVQTFSPNIVPNTFLMVTLFLIHYTINGCGCIIIIVTIILAKQEQHFLCIITFSNKFYRNRYICLSFFYCCSICYFFEHTS